MRGASLVVITTLLRARFPAAMMSSAVIATRAFGPAPVIGGCYLPSRIFPLEDNLIRQCFRGDGRFSLAEACIIAIASAAGVAVLKAKVNATSGMSEADRR